MRRLNTKRQTDRAVAWLFVAIAVTLCACGTYDSGSELLSPDVGDVNDGNRNDGNEDDGELEDTSVGEPESPDESDTERPETDSTEVDGVGDALDVGPPTCGDARVECRASDGTVVTNYTMSEFDAEVVCALVGPSSITNNSTWSASWPDGYRIAIGYDAVQAGQDVELRGGMPTGTADWTVRAGDCTWEAVTITYGPPAEGILIELRWTTLDGTLEEVWTDLDLHVRRNDDACWFDDDDDLHYGARSSSLDWGVRGDNVDNPRIGYDVTTAPGVETVFSQSQSNSEGWTVAFEARLPGETSAAVRATLNVYVDGERVAQVAEEVGEPVFVVAVRLDQAAATTEVARFASAPLCAPVFCDDGRPAVDEICNGVDDDCDGTVDEHHEACRTESGGDTFRCVFLPDTAVEPWRCVD